MCGVHSRPPRPQCVFVRNGHRCEARAMQRNEECQHHHAARVRRERWQLWRATHNRIFLLYTEGMDPLTAQQVTPVLWIFVRRATAERLRNPGLTDQEAMALHPAPTVQAMMNEILGAPAGTLPPRTDLEAMARDSQNVHTRAVSEQTNRGIDLLMAVEVPETQNTMVEIRAEWTRVFTILPVQELLYEDMMRWWNIQTCVNPSDWLYRKLLRRLWAKIKTTKPEETRLELVKRLQQECAESYRLCCIGHINRLVNVMVGFDEGFKQDVPKGLLLQERFARLSAIEDDVERFRQATEIIAELGLTTDEAAPWLDAIST